VYQSQNALLMDIDSMRKLMVASAQETGFTSMETIRYSQELDRLIFKYQTSCKDAKIRKQRRKYFSFRKMIFFAKKQCGHAGA
jgi:stage 0 sporulation regulatory protein